MPHGGPDWGTEGPLGTVYTIQDMAELAVRLGSIVTFDRRGNVVFLSSFEDSLNPFLPLKSGDNAEVKLVNETSRNGATSCLLRPGDAIGDFALIQHYSPFPVSSKLGMEFSFAAKLAEVIVSIIGYLDDAVEQHFPRIDYDYDTQELSYYDSRGEPQVIASNLKLWNHIKIFHTIKAVIDLAKKEYVRVVLNNVEYDLSGVKYEMIDTTGTTMWVQRMRAETKVALGAWVYVDDVIITQNEP